MLHLPHLAKLLLQHDSNPDVDRVDEALLLAGTEGRVHCCIHPRGDAVAIALGQRLVTVHFAGNDISNGALEFTTVVEAPEAVSALAWLVSPSQPPDECLVLATTAGYLQLHAPDGEPILRQELHHLPAASIAVRWSGGGLDSEDRSEDITIAFTDGAIVRIACWEAWAAARWHAGRRGRGAGSGSQGGGGWFGGEAGSSTPPHVAFDKWQLPKGTGPRSHAICLGLQQPPLYSLLTSRRQAPHLLILTSGTNPPLASCLVDEAAGPSILSLATDLARTTASSLLGTARGYLPFGRSSHRPGAQQGSGGEGQQRRQQQQQKRPKIPGEAASLGPAVWDEKRAITRTGVSPCGRLAACCDNLGRVLLVDTASTLVVRVLKGYRDAQAAWLVACGSPAGRPDRPASAASNAASSSWPASLAGSSNHSSSSSSLDAGEGGLAGQPSQAQQQQQQQEQEQEQRGQGGVAVVQQQPSSSGGQLTPLGSSMPGTLQEQEQQQEPVEPGQVQEQLYLVIYAPRRSVVEVWHPLSGRRLGSLSHESRQSLLIQQPVPRRPAPVAGSTAGSSADSSGSERRGGGSRCWVLDLAALTLADVTPKLTALVC